MAKDYAYDLFVSYAHEQDPKWVRLVVEQLQLRLSRLLRQPPKLSFDEQMRAGSIVSKTLIEDVSASRLLLIILSPKYLESPWCQMELRTFLEAGGDVADPRIFVLEAERIDRQEWPDALRDHETILFWKEDRVTKIPERLDPALGEEHAQEFNKRVGETAHFIADRLRAPEDDAPESKGDVWIAEPTDDLVSEWEDLAAAVRQAGWRVLPAAPYPTHDHGAYTQAVRHHLSNAKLLVQLFGPTPGRKPAWGGPQFPILQATEAQTVIRKRAEAKKPGVRWLRWRRSSPPQDDTSAYCSLLREGEVQESSFGEFKTEVIRYLSAPDGPLIPVKSSAAPSVVDESMPVQVYVHSDEVDQPLAEEIMESLVPLNVFTVGTPRSKTGLLAEAAKKSALEQQQDIVAGCHGVILVYGATPPGWASSNFSILRKAFAMVRPRGNIGVLNGPPPDTPRVEIRGPVVVPLDCTNGLKPAVLAHFIDKVRQQAISDGDRV